MSVWDEGLRLVVLDLETCHAPDGSDRIVSIGIAVTRGSGISRQWGRYINPGVPIDAETTEKHHITNAHVASEPRFVKVVPEIMAILAPEPGETVVLCAHNAPYDIPILRAEFVRAQETLPDLPVLDTMAGLRTLAGLRGRAGLLSVLAELGLSNPKHHNAMADATATAKAAVVMISRAAAAGHTTIASLLGDRHSVTTVIPAPPIERRERPAPPAAPASHQDAHEEVTDLVALIAECAQVRCDRLRSMGDELPPPALRPLLFAQLARSAAVRDATGTATVLGALAPLLGSLPDTLSEARSELPGMRKNTGSSTRRVIAIGVAGWLEETLAPISRCPSTDYCPTCADGLPCPRDAWAGALAAYGLEVARGPITNFWRYDTAADRSGRGYLVVRATSPTLADAMLRRTLDFWEANDAPIAAIVAEGVWLAGHRTPLIAERRARRVAAAGREADLRVALGICIEALENRDGNTNQDWAALAVRKAQIEAALARIGDPLDPPHHPPNPKRAPRPTRFLRPRAIRSG